MSEVVAKLTVTFETAPMTGTRRKHLFCLLAMTLAIVARLLTGFTCHLPAAETASVMTDSAVRALVICTAHGQQTVDVDQEPAAPANQPAHEPCLGCLSHKDLQASVGAPRDSGELTAEPAKILLSRARLIVRNAFVRAGMMSRAPPQTV